MPYKDNQKNIECSRRYRLKNKEKYSYKNKSKEQKDKIIKYNSRYHKIRDSGLYIKYSSAIRRCRYPSQRHYRWYGALGIRVIWKTYKDFKDDMYASYLLHLEKYGHKQTTLDRIDVNGNYCKENCRWATLLEQAHNKRKTKSSV